MSVNLFTVAATPVSTVVGLRILCELISERPSSVEPTAESLLVRIISCLSVHYEGRVETSASDMRCRWWQLMVMCEMFGAYGPTLQLMVMDPL